MDPIAPAPPATPSEDPREAALVQAGLLRPRPPADAAMASNLLKPVVSGGTKAMRVSPAMMKDEALVSSFAAMEPFLPAMNLAIVPTEDGGAYIYDPSKVDPRKLAAGVPVGKAKPDGGAPAPGPTTADTPVDPAQTSWMPVQNGGGAGVNTQRAKSLGPPPAPGKGGTPGLLGGMMQRAY